MNSNPLDISIWAFNAWLAICFDAMSSRYDVSIWALHAWFAICMNSVGCSLHTSLWAVNAWLTVFTHSIAPRLSITLWASNAWLSIFKGSIGHRLDTLRWAVSTWLNICMDSIRYRLFVSRWAIGLWLRSYDGFLPFVSRQVEAIRMDAELSHDILTAATLFVAISAVVWLMSSADMKKYNTPYFTQDSGAEKRVVRRRSSLSRRLSDL